MSRLKETFLDQDTGKYLETSVVTSLGVHNAALPTPGQWELRYCLMDNSAGVLNHLGRPMASYYNLNRDELEQRAKNLREQGIEPDATLCGIREIDKWLNELAAKHPGQVVGTTIFAEQVSDLDPFFSHTASEVPMLADTHVQL